MSSIFLSYSHKDQKWARQFVEQLAKEGIDVWDSESELLPGDNWSLEIGKALQRANGMIVLVSPNWLSSPQSRREIEYALGSEKFRDRLIPVIVRPTDHVPWILKHLEPIEGDSPSQVSERVVKRLKDRAVASS